MIKKPGFILGLIAAFFIGYYSGQKPLINKIEHITTVHLDSKAINLHTVTSSLASDASMQSQYKELLNKHFILELEMLLTLHQDSVFTKNAMKSVQKYVTEFPTDSCRDLLKNDVYNCELDKFIKQKSILEKALSKNI